MKPRVLVLGASGFIGRRIVARLASSAFEPVMARHRSRVPSFPGLESLAVDACSASDLEAALDGVSAIINSVTGHEDTIRANADALFAVAARHSSLRVIHLSSMAVYGEACGLVDEDAAFGGSHDAYALAKRMAEQRAARCPNVICLRPGIVYGPGSGLWSLLIGQLLIERRLGPMGRKGSGLCNLVHVDDVAEAALCALRQPQLASRAYNLGLSLPPSWNDYFTQYASALGLRQLAPLSAPRLQYELRLRGPLLTARQRLSGEAELPTAVRPWLLRLCRQPILLDVHRATRELGWVPRPLSKGLQETAAWFHARGKPAERR